MLFPEHNLMNFYTWGDTNCCLPTGATEATLLGTFSESAGRRCARSSRRCSVRGPAVPPMPTSAIAARSASPRSPPPTPAGQPLVDPLFDVNGKAITSAAQTPQPVTEIQWSQRRRAALPGLHLLARSRAPTTRRRSLTNVSVVLGNVVLADHGLTMPAAGPGNRARAELFYAPNPAAGYCAPPVRSPLPVRFLPKLA